MNSMKSIFTGSLLSLGLLLAAGQPAHAVQAVWDGAYTPLGGGNYAEWNVFNDTSAAASIQDNTPEVSLIGSSSYQVAETTGGSFLTSGGNIYSPFAPIVLNTTASGLGAGSSDVYLRVSSLGNFNTTLNQAFTGFTLNGVAGTYTELFREVSTIVTPGGASDSYEVEALVRWLGITHTGSLSIAFNSIGDSVSLDQVSLDVRSVAPVPLPAAAYLMASGLVGIAAMARRRMRAA